MLKKPYRLKKRKSFNYIYRKGRHVGNDALTLVFVHAKLKYPHIKIGFSVSKKVGNSVIRHKATRRMREGVKPLLPLIKPNHSLIFVAKEGVDKLKPIEIQKKMEQVLAKVQLLNSQ